MLEREKLRHKVISTILAIVALAIFCGIIVVGAPQLFFG
jgi:hypothetical protein